MPQLDATSLCACFPQWLSRLDLQVGTKKHAGRSSEFKFAEPGPRLRNITPPSHFIQLLPPPVFVHSAPPSVPFLILHACAEAPLALRKRTGG